MSYTNKIIILAGQSNAVGRVNTAANLPAARQGYKYNVKVWNGTTFEALNANVENNNQYDDSNSAYGVEMFLPDYATGLGRDVYLLKLSHGGTRMTQSSGGATWNVNNNDSRDWHQELKDEIDNIITFMDGRSKLYKFEAVIWMQGESDCDSDLQGQGLVNPDNYSTDFTAFKNDVQSHITTQSAGNDTPIWLIAPLSPLADREAEFPIADINNVRGQQQTYCTNNSDSFEIDTSDVDNFDGIHYDAAGMAAMGGRIETILNAQITP